MIPRRLISLSCIALLAFSQRASAQEAAAAPTTEPSETPESFAKDQREMLTDLRAVSPATPPRPLDELINMDVVDGRLIISVPKNAEAKEANFSVDGDASTAFHLAVGNIDAATGTRMIRANYMHYDAPAGRSVSVDVLPTPWSLNLSVTTQALTGTTTAQLIEQASQPGDEAPSLSRLYMTRSAANDGPDDTNFNVAEPNFAALVVAHHDEALAMLGEGLTSLRGMHVLSGIGLAEAREIFAADRTLDAGATNELDAILADLQKRGSDTIPELRTRLRKLGPPAAQALSRRPRDHWSVDLALNVDTLTAGLLAGGIDRAEALLASPPRLFDLLYAPDPMIRHGAMNRLQTLTKEKITLDVEGDPYRHVAQIEALRAKLALPKRR